MPASIARARRAVLAFAIAMSIAGAAAADQVIPDDLIVQSSICAGVDCVNNESFGTDTIRMKQNVLRFGFIDTSTSAGFATVDWQLTANDADGLGGGEYFAIDNLDAGTRIFRLDAGAPANSVFVDALGNLGLGTSTPGMELHLLDSDTPGIRMQQDASAGNPEARWDIAGNEANFFVREFGAATGTALPLRVRPGAPTNTLLLGASGFVGIGMPGLGDDPQAALHVYGQDGVAQLRIEEASSTPQPRTLLELINHGPAQIQLSDTDAGAGWRLEGSSTFSIAADGAATPQFALAANGDLAITGTLSQGSSRTLKTAIQAVDAAVVFSAAMQLPVYEWSYRGMSERHLGPMAEDFHASFGLGADPQRLAPSDVAGVALVAVQELAGEVEQRKRDIAEIRARIDALEARAQ